MIAGSRLFAVTGRDDLIAASNFLHETAAQKGFSKLGITRAALAMVESGAEIANRCEENSCALLEVEVDKTIRIEIEWTGQTFVPEGFVTSNFAILVDFTNNRRKIVIREQMD